jgi:hypothetical protein
MWILFYIIYQPLYEFSILLYWFYLEKIYTTDNNDLSICNAVEQYSKLNPYFNIVVMKDMTIQ